MASDKVNTTEQIACLGATPTMAEALAAARQFGYTDEEVAAIKRLSTFPGALEDAWMLIDANFRITRARLFPNREVACGE